MAVHHNILGARPKTTERVFAQIAGPEQGARQLIAYENVLLPGTVVPLHMHAVEELLVCLSGTAECCFSGGAPQTYSAGSVVIIPANTPHKIRNTGSGEPRQLSFFPAVSQDTTWLEPQGSVE